MSDDTRQFSGAANAGGRFLTTHWTVVMNAADSRSPDRTKALETLCGAYWYPLYVYVRRGGFSPEDAQDLTQSFFASLLEKQIHGAADPGRGKFRTFLLTAMKNFLAKAVRKSHAQKRGGGAEHLSLQLQDAEGRYLNEPSHDASPDKLFERTWANALLERALSSLRKEYEARGEMDRFDAMSAHLVQPETGQSYAGLAEELGMTEGSVKTAMHRLRRRYRDVYRREVEDLVDGPDQVDDEIRHLLSVL